MSIVTYAIAVRKRGRQSYSAKDDGYQFRQFEVYMFRRSVLEQKLNQAIDTFIGGIGHSNIIAMCLIYLLAGGFAAVAKATGGVDATVALGLSLIPSNLLLPGFFVIAAFIATAMGTSMGTIAAVAPIALGVADQAQIDYALMAGAVMSGALFMQAVRRSGAERNSSGASRMVKRSVMKASGQLIDAPTLALFFKTKMRRPDIMLLCTACPVVASAPSTTMRKERLWGALRSHGSSY